MARRRKTVTVEAPEEVPVVVEEAPVQEPVEEEPGVPDIVTTLKDILVPGDEPVAVSYVASGGLRATAVFDVDPGSLAMAYRAFTDAGFSGSEDFVRYVEEAVGVLAYDSAHGAVHRMNLM